MLNLNGKRLNEGMLDYLRESIETTGSYINANFSSSYGNFMKNEAAIIYLNLMKGAVRDGMMGSADAYIGEHLDRFEEDNKDALAPGTHAEALMKEFRTLAQKRYAGSFLGKP